MAAMTAVAKLNTAIDAAFVAFPNPFPSPLCALVAQYAAKSFLFVVGGVEPFSPLRLSSNAEADVAAYDDEHEEWVHFLPTLKLPTGVMAVTVEGDRATIYGGRISQIGRIDLSCAGLIKAMTTELSVAQLVVPSPEGETWRSRDLVNDNWRYSHHGDFVTSTVVKVINFDFKCTTVALPHYIDTPTLLMYQGRLIVGGGNITPTPEHRYNDTPNEAVYALALNGDGGLVASDGPLEQLAPLSQRAQERYGRDRTEPMEARLVVLNGALFAIQMNGNVVPDHNGCVRSNVLLRYCDKLNIWVYCAFMHPRVGFGTLVL